MAHWKYLLIAVCLAGVIAGFVTIDIGARKTQSEGKSQNASAKSALPKTNAPIGPTLKTPSGFGPVIQELDINRIVNAKPVVVPFDDRTKWTALIEEGLVQRNAVLRGLRLQLQESIAKPDRSYGGKLHYVVIAIGEFRDRESLPQLAPLFDFELNQSTSPPCRCFPIHFPVAHAISEIGGLEAADLMVKRANEKMSGRQVFLAAWILRESLSENRAQEYLRLSLVDAKSPLQVRNINRLMEFMESEPAKLSLNGLSGELIDGMMQKHFPGFVESN